MTRTIGKKMINPSDFELFGVWDGVNVLEGLPWYSSEAAKLHEKLTGTHPEILFFIRNYSEHLHFSKKYLQEVERYWEKTPQKEALKMLEGFYEKQQEIAEKIKRAGQIDEKTTSDEKLGNAIQKTLNASTGAVVYSVFVMVSEKAVFKKLEKYLHRELREQGRDGEYREVLSVVTTPPRKSSLLQEELELAKVAIKKHHGKNIANYAEELAEK